MRCLHIFSRENSMFLRCVALKKAVLVAVKDLCTFSSDSSCQLDVFWHNRDPLCVDGAQIGVFEETNQVSLGGFLQGSDGCALESQVGLEILGDLSYQSLEGQLSDE
jgi:histone H3